MCAKATSRSSSGRQGKTIPGTFDEASTALSDKAREYVETLQKRMKLQTKEKDLREELIPMFKKEDVEELDVDTHTVSLEHTETDKIHIKAIATDEPEAE